MVEASWATDSTLSSVLACVCTMGTYFLKQRVSVG